MMERSNYYAPNESVNSELEKRRSQSRKADPPEVEETMALKTKKGIVTNCFFVNVRSAPEGSNSANVIGQAQKGGEWEITKKVGSYYQIQFNGRPAYISQEFMEIKDE